MDIKSFRKIYGLELIPVALETLTLGKCVWDAALFGKPKFAHSGMPDYIFLAFKDEDLITIEQVNSYLADMRQEPLVNSSFAQVKIEFDLDEAADLEIAERINASANFKLSNSKSFSISNSKGRGMPMNVRSEIDSLLEELKDKHWNEYKKKLRRAFIITELYYGELSINIDLELQAEFEATIATASLEAANKTALNRTITYTFPNNGVPFAMRLERIKNF